jgi:hypothetical protein
MDVNTLGVSFGTGLGLGLFVLFWITAIFLPASYAMNRFVYHGTFMRIILGVIAGCGSIFSLIIMAIFRMFQIGKPIRYFGLLPIFESDTSQSSNPISHPFMLFFNSNVDTNALNETFKHLLVPKEEQTQGQEPTGIEIKESTGKNKKFQIKSGVIHEELYDYIRNAGAIKDKEKWKDQMDGLSRACTAMFSTQST